MFITSHKYINGKRKKEGKKIDLCVKRKVKVFE